MSSEESAFIRAIHAAPADDAPRLVYADWLDEHGDPRGQFLRAEVRAVAEFRAGRAATARGLRKAAGDRDLRWALSVARPPVGVCAAIRFSRSGAPVTAADLDAAEKRARLKLPADYRAFLLVHNGGVPDPNEFDNPGNGDNTPDMVAEFFPFEPRKGLTTVFDNYSGHVDDVEPERAQSLFGVGMPSMDEDCLAISVAPEDFGAVYYQPYIEGLREPTRVADSFAEFLALLRPASPAWIRMARDGDASGIRGWLQDGGDPMSQDPATGVTPLELAIIHNRLRVASALLKAMPKPYKGYVTRLLGLVREYNRDNIGQLIEEYLKGR